MASRKTIYLSDATEAVIDATHSDSLSGRINSIVVRYGQIVGEECPALSEAEWSALVDALNGVWLLTESGTTDPSRYIWAEVMDCQGLGEKWGIDADALARRVRGMSVAQQIAIAEIAQRFWGSPRLNDLPTADLLRECGARIA